MEDETASSWTMAWDDDGQETDARQEEVRALALPEGTTLIARILGEPSPGIREPRTSFLCANDSGTLVTRLEDGSPLWSQAGQGQPRKGVGTQSVPEDRGGECQAMFDGWHLIEWLNSTSYRSEHGRLTGTAEYYGPFEAETHGDYGFVTRVDVQVGTPHARRLIEVQAWRLVKDQPALLESESIDLRGYFD